MKLTRTFFALMLWFAVAVFAETAMDTTSAVQTKASTDVAFAHAYVTVEGGEIYPFGDLIDAVDNTLYGGIGFKYDYLEHVDGFVLFDYAYFTPVPEHLKIYGVHQFRGKLGVDFRWTKIRPLAIGVGFACDWTRADFDEDDIDHKSFSEDLGGTLTDNETEFGWFARLNLPLTHTKWVDVGLNVMWEELWTLPERSDMLSVGVYVERRLW